MLIPDLFSLIPLSFTIQESRSKVQHNQIADPGINRASDPMAYLSGPAPGVEEVPSSESTFVSSRDTQAPKLGEHSLSSDMESSNNHANQDRHAKEQEHTTNQDIPFTAAIQQYRQQLDEDYLKSEQDHNTETDQDVVIDEGYWEKLQSDYEKEVGSVVVQEQDIIRRFDHRFKQFMLWMQVSNERETTRALKRLKTQASFVQISEDNLRKQEEHYEKVMQAFQSAMSLLSRPS